MALRPDVKTTFEPTRVIQPIYTGGSVALSEDGKILATCLGEEALLTNLATGEHLARIEGDGEPITTLALAPDASFLVICSRSVSMRIYALQHADDGMTATLTRTLKPHSTPVVTLAVDSTSSLLATGGADGTVRVWDLRGGYTTHTFHGHSGVVSALHFFHVDVAADHKAAKSRKRKSRDVNEDTEVTVQDDATVGMRLASGSEDGKIRIWDLHKRKGVVVLDSHSSVVRSLDYSPALKILLSASRDKTVILWDATTWQIQSTIPILEGVESAAFTLDGSFFYTGGETATLRIWSTATTKEITREQTPGTETEAIIQVLYCPSSGFLLTVHADQTLLLHSLSPLQSTPSEQIPPLPILRRISGTHDEVIDLAYIGPQKDLLALATNLEDIRIISLLASDDTSTSSGQYFGADIALLKGHSDIIITLATDWSGHWLATGAKDNTAKLWRLDPDNESYTCHATFTGHAESIGAITLPNSSPQLGSQEYNKPLSHPPKFLITGSQDKTIKRWSIATNPSQSSRALYTRKAHDKDINALATSHSSTSPLFASASQDRTVKIWDADTGEAIGVLRGHKRGVWSVAFSPPGIGQLSSTASNAAGSNAKGMLVTGSGDKSVKIWGLGDYSCLRTFEGHANSVLKVVWLPRGNKAGQGRSGGGGGMIQVASAAGDGLVKVWDAQEGECVATLDNHIDRVWALAVKPPPILSASAQSQTLSADSDMPDAAEDDDDDDAENSPNTNTPPPLELLSGSADSTLTFWTDTTTSTTQLITTRATARIEQDQTLQNLIRSNSYREAITLALQLNHPKRLLDLFTAVVNGKQEEGSFSGRKDVDEVIAGLSDGQMWLLLLRLRDWNANARTQGVAQRVVFAVLHLVPKERLVQLRRRKRGQGNEALVNGMMELDVGDGDGKVGLGKGNGKESVKDVFDALRVYTERYCERFEKLAEERFVLLWALQQMDEVGGVAELTNGHVNGYTKGRQESVVEMDDGI